MADTMNAKEDMTFKQGMDELERIVASLESGEMELEQSLDAYAKGVKLLGALQNKLDAAEQQVQVLMGQLAQAPEDDVQDSTLSKA